MFTIKIKTGFDTETNFETHTVISCESYKVEKTRFPSLDYFKDMFGINNLCEYYDYNKSDNVVNFILFPNFFEFQWDKIDMLVLTTMGKNPRIYYIATGFYVINENGKTIDKHRFDGMPNPIVYKPSLDSLVDSAV
jgi:hypothetical protein